MENPEVSSSPRWGAGLKLVITLTVIALFAGLIVRFQHILGPLLMAFVVAYLVYPIIDWIRKRLHIPWKITVTILYLIIIMILLGGLTAGGVALFEQIQSLINFLQGAIQNLPEFFESLTARQIQLGPFTIDFTHLDVNMVFEQVVGGVQPLLSRLGTMIGNFASSAASGVGWTVFILLASFFLLLETGGFRERIINLKVPGYEQDMARLGIELDRIWNAFLRGQAIIFILTYVIYTFTLGVLGVRFYFGLAVLAGLARFVPYVGPAIAWTSFGLVAYFQGSTVFGLSPTWYVLLVIAMALVTDVIMDNVIWPRLMSESLQVHPAALMVGAIMAANLFGFIGIMLSAPVLASGKLLLTYIMRKLFDQDPWVGMRVPLPQAASDPIPLKIKNLIKGIKSRFQRGITIGKKS
ncbi:MAG TPA: AI-2E family transporter [Anaerolineaceae bacterium]